jgi:tetrahydromethanopterin S-methyltransferase subunit G
MALAQEDIEQIQWLIKKTVSEMPETLNANVRYELDLRERAIRVEEELKHQRELMVEGFKQMEKRFEQVEKRFEQVDKRFEQVDKRFEQVDKRFEQMQLDMNKRFEQVEKRLDQVDKRLEQQHQEIMGLHHEIKLLMRWSFGTLLAIGGLIVAVLRLVP